MSKNTLRLSCEVSEKDFLEVKVFDDKDLQISVRELGKSDFESVLFSTESRDKVELLRDVLNMWLEATEGEVK